MFSLLMSLAIASQCSGGSCGVRRQIVVPNPPPVMVQRIAPYQSYPNYSLVPVHPHPYVHRKRGLFQPWRVYPLGR